MYVTDLQHFVYLPADVPGPAVRLAEQTWAIVRAATAGEESTRWVTALPCRRRPGHRPCPGRIVVFRNDPSIPIEWACSSCGDEGVISNWSGTPFDLRRVSPDPDRPQHPIVLSDTTLALLREIELLDVYGDHAVYGARFDDDRNVLSMSSDVLDDLIDSLVGESNQEEVRNRRRRLDAACRELNSARANLRENEVETSMQIPPEIDVARVRRWCEARVPERVRHQVRVECDVTAEHVTIVECRAPWNPDLDPEWSRGPVARLRYAADSETWTLYWRDRDLRFHVYDGAVPTRFVDELLAEIDEDPTAIFWG